MVINKIQQVMLAILLLGLALPTQAALRVVTTTADLAALVRAVGADDVSVQGLTPGTRDPHFAEAKPSMIRKVFRADLLVVVGADMEIGWLPPLLQSARNGRVQPGSEGCLDLSQTVTLLDVPTGPVSRAMGDVHAKGNPHYWLDPRNGLRMAEAIARKLAQLDPAHTEDYQQRLAAFRRALEARISQWQAALGFLKGKPVISYHTSFRYLAEAFGFRVVGQVEPKPGIAPSASYLAQLVRRIREQHIRLLIMEPYYERRSANYLHEQTGIQVAVLPQSVGALPGIDDYLQLFDAIVDVLKKAEDGQHG